MLLLLLLLLHRRGGGRQGVVCRPAAHTWSEGLASLLDGYPIPAIGSFSLSNAEPPCDPLFFEFGIEPIRTELQYILWLVYCHRFIEVLEDGRVHWAEGHVCGSAVYCVLYAWLSEIGDVGDGQDDETVVQSAFLALTEWIGMEMEMEME